MNGSAIYSEKVERSIMRGGQKRVLYWITVLAVGIFLYVNSLQKRREDSVRLFNTGCRSCTNASIIVNNRCFHVA